MGAAASAPPADTETPVTSPLSASDRRVHAAAKGWATVHLCRAKYDALYKCKKQGGTDCGAEQLAVDECKAEMEPRALRQLQSNAMVQCPREWSAYSKCMAAFEEEVQPQPREECKRLWMDMQMCAAFHVVAHMESQAGRPDGKFAPPPMYPEVTPVQR